MVHSVVNVSPKATQSCQALFRGDAKKPIHYIHLLSYQIYCSEDVEGLKW